MIDQDYMLHEVTEKFLEFLEQDQEAPEREAFFFQPGWLMQPEDMNHRVVFTVTVSDGESSGTFWSFWNAGFDDDSKPVLDLLLHDFDSVMVRVYERRS